jgi:glycine C-acetyltransferase
MRLTVRPERNTAVNPPPEVPIPNDRLNQVLSSALLGLEKNGRRKAREKAIVRILPASGNLGPRVLLEGEGEKPFLRMNSNGYLGLSLLSEVIESEEAATREYGTGPGAVRFIGGTWGLHVKLERDLATFHGREAAMTFSSAYGAVLGVLAPLITSETAVISDSLNHNSIISAVRMARPREKYVYGHLDLADLEARLDEASQRCRRAIVVTDGVFSMRGDYAPLKEIVKIAANCDSKFPENVLVVVDDSHGVGAFGATGRGTEEATGCGPVDLLIATLGKAIGVNGGYAVANQTVIEYLREVSPQYVYSNPITPGEAAAAAKAIEILDGDQGRERLAHLRERTHQFEAGLAGMGFETVVSEHPIVPLMAREVKRLVALMDHLWANGILAAGLNFPVVPRGSEEIRFQISADHTEADIDEVLGVLGKFAG